MSNLQIQFHQKTNAAGKMEATIALDGNLDNSTVALLEARLTPTLATKPAELTFDLAALQFLTSAGIRQFLLAVKQQKANGGHTSFINLSPALKEVFAIMGSLPDLKIFRDQAELDAYLLARQRTYLK